MHITLPIDFVGVANRLSPRKLGEIANNRIRQEIRVRHIGNSVPEKIVQLFGCTSKSNTKSCAEKQDFVINSHQFVDLMFNCGSICFKHTKYNVEWQTEPSREALQRANTKLQTGNTVLLHKDLFAAFRDTKLMTFHLFESQKSANEWHLFFFDQNDLVEKNNHWKPNEKEQAHMHYISFQYDFRCTAMQMITDLKKERRTSHKGASHIRFEGLNIYQPSIDDILIWGQSYINYDKIEDGKIELCSQSSIRFGYQ
jgi:hypothetical protein